MTSRAILAGPTVHLGTLGPFRRLSPAHLVLVALETEEVALEAEAWLTRRGVEQKAMHMIVDGHVRVFTADGSVVTGPGGLVGFPDLFVPGAVALGALTDSEVVALRLDTDLLRDVCERNFTVLGSLLTFLAGLVAEDFAAAERVIAGSAEEASAYPGAARDRVLRMLALQRAPAFPLESMDALADLAGRIHATDVAAGDVLWERGDVSEGFWVVGSGAVTVTRGEHAVRVGAGGIPGLPETLAGSPREDRAEVVEPGFLLPVDVDSFMDVLEDHFELAFSLLGWMARHLSSESTF